MSTAADANMLLLQYTDYLQLWKLGRTMAQTGEFLGGFQQGSCDDTLDKECEWLDALEKGILDDNGEVKKEKDISLLTTRPHHVVLLPR